MKKLFFLFLFLLAFIFLAPKSVLATSDRENGSYCSGFYGYLSVDNWPGGSVTISCEGDNGPYCSGDQKTITPINGQPVAYNLQHCSCGEFVPTGLIKVSSALPASCAMATDLSQYVAQNGWDRGADFGIGCTPQAVPTNTPTPTPPVPNKTCEPYYCDSPKLCDNGKRYQMARKCTQGSEVTYEVKCDTGQCALPTPTPRPNATPTLTPTPPLSCPAPAQVPNVQVTCPTCQQ